VQCLSAKAALVLGLLVTGVGVSSRPSSQEPPTSSEPSRAAARFLSDPWDSRQARSSVAQWLDNCRASLVGLSDPSCSSLSLEEVVRLARVSFVPVPPAPDPFASCQSLIRQLEKHGFSVTLAPRCCSHGTSPQPKRSESSHLDLQENDRP